ncbi:chorismate synthase [Patescibacteria group bacterium]|nr:chorismate synthase [Patescibacteria group bacterium]
MPGNTFGKVFKVTTWGESHGKAIGAIVDGCIPGISLCEEDIQTELDLRKPNNSNFGTSRQEDDVVEILSGVFDGKTTGTPISMLVWNQDAKSEDYSKIKDIFRPGHADFTYETKYGIRDYRGGGRSSGRETIGRVMAGAIAKKILKEYKIKIIGHTLQIGPYKATTFCSKQIMKNDIRCADKNIAPQMIEYIEKIRKDGDSVGGIIEIIVKNMICGLGEPVFDKLSANLAKALMSIGSVKGFEIGLGFNSAEMLGSENNDEFYIDKNKNIGTKTNNSGGILGGISNGENLVLKIAVKPTATINKTQKTVNKNKSEKEINVIGRHDACIVPRLIPVAESMVAITLMDHLLMQKTIA